MVEDKGSNAERTHVNLVVIGHVDSGKSTIVGALAKRLGELTQREHDKLIKKAESLNKSSFSLAFYTDTTNEERARGVTIVSKMIRLYTKVHVVDVIDCPGHRDYIKNCIKGVSNIDAILILCPANFAASCSTTGTLWTHLAIAATSSDTKQVCLACNKMDEVQVDNENSRPTAFAACVAAVNQMTSKLGFGKTLTAIPVSAMQGDGLFYDSPKYEWFEGTTNPYSLTPEKKIFSVEGFLDSINPKESMSNKPLRLVVSKVANVSGAGAIICGKVDSGSFKKGDKVRFLPANVATEVKTVEEFNKPVPTATPGMNVGFALTLKDRGDISKIKPGSVMAIAADATFTVAPFYLISGVNMKEGSKGNKKKDSGHIQTGYTPLLTMASIRTPVKFVKLIECSSRKAGKVENPESIPKGARFTAIIKPEKPILMECASDLPFLGRFACTDGGYVVVAASVVKKLSDDEAQSMGVDLVWASNDKDAIKSFKKKRKGDEK